MLRRRARAAAIAAVCSALAAMVTPAAAQHEHHDVPAGSAQVVLTGTAYGAEGTSLSGAIVRLFHVAGPGHHLIATSVTDATGRFAVRTILYGSPHWPGGTPSPRALRRHSSP